MSTFSDRPLHAVAARLSHTPKPAFHRAPGPLATAQAEQDVVAAAAGAQRGAASEQARNVLLGVVRERDRDLSIHGDNVARLAVAVAERLGLPEDEKRHVRYAAELHDIGKVAIPDAVLDKPGALDASEWAFIRQHPVIGERILLAAPALTHTARLVRSSHERWDGAGYPDGLAGSATLLGARIVAVCDAWDAMVTDRPYRKALPTHEALAELTRSAGTQFDPKVVTAFCHILLAAQHPIDLASRAAVAHCASAA